MVLQNVSGLAIVSNFKGVQPKAAPAEAKEDKKPDTVKSPQDKAISVPANILLAQMPNVSFGGRYNYGRDDLSAYDDYEGPQPPQIEIEKYKISKAVDESIENEDYLSAIKGKVKLAFICKKQGKESDSYILEESIRRLYKDLPRYQREEAKNVIRDYNYDMAQYIDEDIKRY